MFFDQFETRQDIYNFVCQKLWKQNKISYRSEQCYYLVDGLKCAIGHLIPPETYRVDFEGRPFPSLLTYLDVHSLNPNNNDLLIFFKKFHDEDRFFIQMQVMMHDDLVDLPGLFRHNFKEAAHNFAEKYGLTPYQFEA